MARWLSRVVPAAFFLALLAGCGGSGSDPADGPSGALAPAAVSQCSGEAAGIIEELFPPPGLLDLALRRCAKIQTRSQRGRTDSALLLLKQFVQEMLEAAALEKLNPPSEGTLEEAMAALTAALYADAGLSVPEQEIVVGQVGAGGGTIVTPGMHAAIEFESGDLGGDVWVTIVQLPLPGGPGQCPFGFPVPHDCYPLYYDVTVHPAGHVIDPATLGFCVLDTGPFAPPNPTVAGRLQIASRDHSNPGQIVFWPVTTGPAAVDCSDLAFAPSGWQGRVLDALGPFAGVFSVTRAYANPGKLGASVSSFTPFAATDPVPNTATAPTLLLPAAGATIPQNNADTAASPASCSFGNGTWGILIDFDWQDVGGSIRYDLELKHVNAITPYIEEMPVSSDFLHVDCSGFIESPFLTGWEWRVRAVDADTVPGPWSAPRSLAFSPVVVSTNGGIRGVVRDEFGAPIAGATVAIDSTAFIAVTDSLGRYVINGVPIPCCTANAGGGTVTHTITVDAAGFVQKQVSVTFTTGRPLVPLNVVLE